MVSQTVKVINAQGLHMRPGKMLLGNLPPFVNG